MRKRWRWLFCALLAGSFLCVCDRFQPFRLKALNVRSFSPELEWNLREWSESFLAFHPAWFLNRGALHELEQIYPLNVDAKWNPLHGTLTLTPIPFVPSIKVPWQHSEYLLSESGVAWRSEKWERALNVPVPELPTLFVGNSFPLLSDLGLNRSARLLVSFEWLSSILERVKARKNVKISSVELIRRGGEDVVTCCLEYPEKKDSVSFIGLVSSLDRSLAAAEELMAAKTGQNLIIDATYGDKVIIKKIAAPSQL